jgi:protein TonB
MNIKYFVFLIVLFSSTIWSQDTLIISNNDKKDKISIIEDVPVFPGCEEIEIKERKNCFEDKILEHISKNFKYPPKAKKQKIEGKVIVRFTINYEGKVTNIITQLSDPILQTEALRIIRLLPVMKPALFRGKPIGINYSVPIIFKLK